ncbi:MAG: cell division protein ZapA [Saprospiraceae bacterium]|nr:cell division protein ZapA [Saprospiraceae bacterium]
MQQDDLKTISVTVAGRTFPVKVTEIEESVVLELTTDLNEKIGEFQQTYPGRDKLDYVIMTMLSYTFDLKKSSVAFSRDALETDCRIYIIFWTNQSRKISPIIHFKLSIFILLLFLPHMNARKGYFNHFLNRITI